VSDDIETSRDSEVLRRVIRLIDSDSFAISFQTMGQYRSALLCEIGSLVKAAGL
jgi:hypothetical protein